jgi:hypothetical protein
MVKEPSGLVLKLRPFESAPAPDLHGGVPETTPKESRPSYREIFREIDGIKSNWLPLDKN